MKKLISIGNPFSKKKVSFSNPFEPKSNPKKIEKEVRLALLKGLKLYDQDSISSAHAIIEKTLEKVENLVKEHSEYLYLLQECFSRQSIVTSAEKRHLIFDKAKQYGILLK